MLRILGSRKRLCDGLTRRDWLLASLGGIAPTLLGAAPAQASPPHPTLSPAGRGEGRSFGSAKNVILLYPFGGPSHVDTFDFKPDAPVEIRGDFKAMPSAIPGCPLCEHLPHTARILDRVTLLRSLTHPWNLHGMQWATTGMPKGSNFLENAQRHPNQWPFVGSVFSYLAHQTRRRKPANALPDNVALPWALSARRRDEPYARPHAAYLGPAFDPIWGGFKGTPTRTVRRVFNGNAAEVDQVADPYLGIAPDSRFQIAEGMQAPVGLTLDRLNQRRSLLDQFDGARRRFDGSPLVRRFDEVHQQAFGLLNSPQLHKALDLDREPTALRGRYGMTLFGQGVLQARRLVEAGCRFVTVIWDEFVQVNTGWDTHVDHRKRMKDELLPGFDRAFAALIEDLEARGLFQETLVLVLCEMGRSPRLQGDGRGHWGRAYTNLMAGAGVARGRIVGKTDKIGAEVVERALTAKDVLATVYHLCGFDPNTTLVDRQNRPMPLVPYGDVIREALA